MSESTSALVIGVSELLRQPGTQRKLERKVRVDGLSMSSSRVTDDEAELELVLEASASSIVVTGTVAAAWLGECRRCLREIDAIVEVEVHEVFERMPVEGETYPLLDDEVDLEEMVREAVMLSLPLAPLCDSACPGPAPEGYPVATEDDDEAAKASDPRWAALDQLHFD